MGFKDLFKQSESLIALDIGASSIRMLELDRSGDKPRLVRFASAPIPSGEIFANNVITNTAKVSDLVATVFSGGSFEPKRIVTAVPGPSVFTKKIKMPKVDANELAANVQFEAGNFIPHNINAVRLDYHVIGESGKNQLDVLVAAVKNEIIESFLETINLAGLEAAVVDVDYFCLQNVFELGYPELIDKTVALVNIGARYSSINICRGGQSLLTGDVASVGGRMFTEALAETLGIQAEDAEKMKREGAEKGALAEAADDILKRAVENAASELNRQLSFLWNASGSDEGIDAIMLTGGSSQVSGLLEELKERTGIECTKLDPIKGIEIGPDVDSADFKKNASMYALAIGMGIREPGDRVIPDF